MTEKMEEQMNISDRDSWCGKTSPEPSAVTKERTSERSSKKRQKWQKGMPAFLDLRTANGHTPDVSWEMGGQLLGEYTMHSFGECPSEEKESRLSQILQGGAAPEILFERESMSGNSAESGEARKGTAEDAERSIGETGRVAATLTASYGKNWNGNAGAYNGENFVILNDQGGSVMGVSENVTGALRAQEHGHTPLVFEPGAASRLGGYCYADKCGTLRADMGDNQPAVCYGISSYESNAMKSANPHSGIYKADTARTLDLNGGNPACNQGGIAVVFDASRRHNYESFGDISETVQAHYGTGGGNVPIVLEGNGSRPSHMGDGWHEGDPMYTLNSTEHHAVCYRGDAITSPVNASNPQPGDPCHTLTDDSRNYVVLENEQPYNATVGSFMRAGNSGIVETLMARDYKDPQIVCTSVVRRLAPMEYERLQGFPDGWTDIGDWIDSKGKKHKGESDSPRYKALGNSIALPFWQWMAEKMVKYIDEQAMGSLFSGIGGFELVFARAGCKPVWNSEIESYPEAVTRVHFGDDDLGIEGDYERYL